MHKSRLLSTFVLMPEIWRDLVKEIIKYICVNILVESETHKLINEFLQWSMKSQQSSILNNDVEDVFCYFFFSSIFVDSNNRISSYVQVGVESKQNFQNCFFKRNIFTNTLGPIMSKYTEFHHIECSLMEHLLRKLEAGFSEFQVSGHKFKMFAFNW